MFFGKIDPKLFAILGNKKYTKLLKTMTIFILSITFVDTMSAGIKRVGGFMISIPENVTAFVTLL